MAKTTAMPINESPDPTHRKLRWRQFGMKTLMLVMLLAILAISWLAVKVRAVQQQRKAVEMIEEVGGSVCYDYQLRPYNDDAGPPPPPGPAWLRRRFGDDVFAKVVDVGCTNCEDADVVLRALGGLPNVQILNLAGGKLADDNLRYLEGLTQLYGLDLSRTTITDAGLVHLRGLHNLKWVVLSRTDVSDIGVKNLQKELPDTEFTWKNGVKGRYGEFPHPGP